MNYITLDDLVGRAMPEGELEVPEWDGLLKWRGLTAATVQRARRRATHSGNINETEFAALIIGFSCEDIEVARYKELLKFESGVLDRVSKYILYRSGYDELAPEGAEEPGEA